ncbi:MAG: 30S ribosomal protein S8 [Verrucomicrobia subdivision 3 bacterium]|nr:30S ribosomal protein S8 [Limisphaerales bacterium]MCS1415988.1 30S ribosomal protein S8 [Limisphaerales bacterium]
MDPIADMLTSIRNASSALLPEVKVPHSKLKEGVVAMLRREGYIQDYRVDGDVKKQIRMTLKYKGRRGVIAGIKRISRPGLRHYVISQDVPRVLGGMGVSILSTSRGVMTGTDAKKGNIGGEVLCHVW